MVRVSVQLRSLVLLVVVALLAAVVALPALAADPSSAPPSGPSTEPAADPTSSPGPGNPARPPGAAASPTSPKSAKTPAVSVTATGTVGVRTDAKGRPEYTLTSGSTVRVLSAGPPWFYGDDNPLKAYVGKQVTVVGTQRDGEDEISVGTVDGKAIREPGRPPWAGGWKVVGKDHPGWSQEKADRWQAKRAEKAERFGVDCWPPGQCKEKPAGDDAEDGDD